MDTREAELIARVLVRDDRHAFAELVKLHQSALRAFLRRLVRGDHAFADDLAQESFIEAYRNLSSFRGDAPFKTWLFGIAYNLFRQSLRARREQPVGPDLALLQTDAESPVPASDLRHDLGEALAELRAEERTALQLCYGEGLSHEEAARVMGCPLGTVKSLVLRAKQRLRGLLDAYSSTS